VTGWPTLDERALHGPAGEFVLETAPHTESDPVALLAQFLVCFGAAAGRQISYTVEASAHHLNEFAVLVGPTGKGRKGSSWDHVQLLFDRTDPQFTSRCISSGLSSGEGLIFEVRDPLDENDGGASDKRRLILEPEFAQVLKVLSREGNTLSPVVRNAWDGKPLQTITRSSPIRATEPHISIVGHITKDELLRFISGTELANGFFNRFMVFAVRRSRELPFGGRLAGRSLERVRSMLTDALQHSRQHHDLTFDEDASQRWREVYGPLSRGEEGLFGAATNRAEAHVVRLASTYATLDQDTTIRVVHLEAALALWRYSADSARWIFGDSFGDPTADEIWEATKERPAGVTRTEVSDMFSRNKKRREIERALSVLEDAGRLRRETRRPEHGRTAEIWIPVLSQSS
jgi:hypothetical protein